ncbi:hypothetical protein RFI_33017 [Reticulomyxa filosa]|uniref:Uncharacterized protein n=1 Tax=Reticulomyxa filosa TaxID=46433 RepID=X6LRZ6_RETFI|nr:hypothetical protein RFI_33017 [Reticulomyxa filosa]|eukprot:ETO04384.1 hypothetical protein RFI_33017 [Reticulomyxa filosa]
MFSHGKQISKTIKWKTFNFWLVLRQEKYKQVTFKQKENLRKRRRKYGRRESCGKERNCIDFKRIFHHRGIFEGVTSFHKARGIKIELDLNDKKWEDLGCETGDEMECLYIRDQNNAITVKEMKLPKLYSGRVSVSSRESTVEVVPLSAYPNEKHEKVYTNVK